MYKLPSNKIIVKVSNHPNTWLELDKNLTEEQIQSKISKHAEYNKTLSEMIEEGYFNSLKYNCTGKKYIKTAMEEFHIPHCNNSGFY